MTPKSRTIQLDGSDIRITEDNTSDPLLVKFTAELHEKTLRCALGPSDLRKVQQVLGYPPTKHGFSQKSWHIDSERQAVVYEWQCDLRPSAQEVTEN